jgi:uncharacterized membrane protein
MKPAPALAAILVTGAALHLPFLGASSLWLDEALTVLPAVRAEGVRSLVDLVRALDTQPPASHLILYLLRDVLPAGEIGWRLPNFVALQAGLVFLYLLARRAWDTRTALVAVAIAEVSPYLAFYGGEARNYGLWFLAVCVSWWLLARWMGADTRPRTLAVAAWGIANGAGLLVHLFHAFAIVTQWAVIAAAARTAARGAPRRRLLAAAGAGTLLALVVFAPWTAVLATSAVAGGSLGVNWTRPPTPATLASLPYALSLGFSWGPGLREAHADDLAGVVWRHAVALGAAAIVMALVAVAALRLCLGRGAPADAVATATASGAATDRAAFLLVPAIGVAGPVAYALATHFPLHPRHLMYLAPVVPLLLARLLVAGGSGRWAAAALVLLQAGALYNLRADPAYARDDERGAVRFAEAQSPGAACIVGDTAPLYVTRATGLQEQFDDVRNTRLCADAVDLWWVENRPWEDPEGRMRRRLERAAAARGLVEAGREDRFAGITLHHWRKPEAVGTPP